MEIVGTVARELVQYTIEPIKRRLRYLIHHNRNLDTLKKQIQKLGTAQVGVQALVDAAKNTGEKIKEEVENWLTIANETLEESKTFLEVEENQRCSITACSDLMSWYRVSRKAGKKNKEIDEHLRNKFDRVSLPAPLPILWRNLPEDLEVFESRRSTLEGIMTALKDANVSTIGVYGVAGIGKTTLVEQVAKQAGESDLFDEIVMPVVVSEKPDIKQIQSDIAEMLGLKLTETNGRMRADRLCKRMKQKRVLVILDDLWEKVDLKAIGIPHANDHEGCKIVLTSRIKDVRDQMSAQVTFQVNTLSNLDSMNLFRKMAGGYVDFPDLAKDIVAECGGLPSAIVTVAWALGGKEIQEWRDALRQLRVFTH